MKASIASSALVSAMKFIAPAVMARPVAPILAGVEIAAAADGVELRATDHETSARAVAKGLVQDDFAPVVVSHRLLTQVLSVSSGDVDLTRDDDDPRAPLVITSGRARWDLPVIVGEFPGLPAVPPPLGAVAADALRAAVKVVAPAASTDDTSHLAMSALAMEFGDEGLDVVATDSVRVHVQTIAWAPSLNAPPGPTQLLAVARTFGRFIESLSGEVEVAADENNIRLSSQGRSITARQVAPPAGKWIAWRPFLDHVAPDRLATTAVIDASALALGLRQSMALASVEANKQRMITLALTPAGIRIDSGEQEQGTAGVDIDAEVSGRPVRIVTAVAHLLDALAGVAGPQVQLGIVRPSNAPVAVGAPGEPPAAIVMSLRREIAVWLDEA